MTSLAFSQLEGCLVETDIVEGGEIEYVTESAMGVIFAGVLTGFTEVQMSR